MTFFMQISRFPPPPTLSNMLNGPVTRPFIMALFGTIKKGKSKRGPTNAI